MWLLYALRPRTCPWNQRCTKPHIYFILHTSNFKHENENENVSCRVISSILKPFQYSVKVCCGFCSHNPHLLLVGSPNSPPRLLARISGTALPPRPYEIRTSVSVFSYILRNTMVHEVSEVMFCFLASAISGVVQNVSARQFAFVWKDIEGRKSRTA